ncbi:MAG: KH domain-containing protein [Methanobacteriaceae archaeon]|jgi:ribosomal RNA assembly protein|nr:KH domain-containing protein [Methanobacteriaceae archaeon]PKL67589.1 MAG: RNA-processing protein [Methanobacteriales archaeon HGW-Methanobacteriales-1]MDP2837088.1 KH domain-containing protein [Methanobacteriaceae archaeon]MDP3034060.1 KH domain-containing protein [Methanobacteriaceae archaeon]MDP3485635.1 KH domain-containing protein [Methanobacteriaceae archaeon]
MTTTEYLKIPRERVGVLIGKKGEVKQHIEKLTQTTLDIDSEAGTVTIIPQEDLEDPLLPWKTRSIVKAIGRGFNPEIALRLLKDDVALDIIKLTEYVGKSKKALARQKGRIIGRDGITRQIIHEMTGVDMSVYGKTVSIIGDLENLLIAKEAVEMILNGSRHKSVYGFLEKKKQDMKLKHFHETINLK